MGFNPSPPTGEVSCPRCCIRLWFLVVESKARLCPHKKVSPKLKDLFAALVSSPDSVDLVELVMELEDELGFSLDLKQMPQIRSLVEWIDYLIQNFSNCGVSTPPSRPKS
jgi:hypothetical protein